MSVEKNQYKSQKLAAKYIRKLRLSSATVTVKSSQEFQKIDLVQAVQFF
jgi:hypothetical protein